MDYMKYFNKNKQNVQSEAFKKRQGWPKSGPSGVQWLEKPKNAR